MPKRSMNLNAPLQSLRNAAVLTGLSVGAIRKGCIEGKIPHVRVGAEYRVNIPLFLAQLEAESMQAVKSGGKTE